jgi:hypothetical protein
MNILFISNLYNAINYTDITDLLKIMVMCRRTVLSRSAIMDDCDEKVESIQRIPSIYMLYLCVISTPLFLKEEYVYTLQLHLLSEEESIDNIQNTFIVVDDKDV